jgi:hypothetical protein
MHLIANFSSGQDSEVKQSNKAPALQSSSCNLFCIMRTTISFGKYLYSVSLIFTSSSPFLGFLAFFYFSSSALAFSSSNYFCSKKVFASSASAPPRFCQKSKI